MQSKPSEERLAKAAYNWLRVSPLLTISTLFFVNGIDIAYSFCNSNLFTCSYEEQSYINLGIGVLVSALWHLILLQYVNNKDSEFVRKHGKQALIYTGIRTAVAFTGVLLDFLLGASGNFACITILVLLILWATQLNTSMEKIKKRARSKSEYFTRRYPSTTKHFC